MHIAIKLNKYKQQDACLLLWSFIFYQQNKSAYMFAHLLYLHLLTFLFNKYYKKTNIVNMLNVNVTIIWFFFFVFVCWWKQTDFLYNFIWIISELVKMVLGIKFHIFSPVQIQHYIKWQDYYLSLYTVFVQLLSTA